MSRLLRAGGALLTGGLAAVTARAAYAALNQNPPGGRQTWTRTNHRGEAVTLLEGPAAAAAAAAVSLIAGGMPARSRAALAVAGAGSALFGGYDDLRGSAARRGFRGHLEALARGEVTTGAVKMAGIGGTGLAAAALLGGISADAGSGTDLVVNAGLVAGAANLLNLFDLRPGRALKVALAGGSALGAVSPAGALARRSAPRWRCCPRTSANGRCWAMPGPTRSAPCSASLPRRPCREGRGSRPWRRSPG